ncbi:MAG: M20 family metallo-hydrolase [Deltaproteobacteria bacterium]|nr:M20 family metallo-hydrolase [Deltaproteobacteria bacterium]
MSATWKKISDRLETYTDELVALQSDLVACPALGPDNNGPGEEAKAALLESWLEKIRPDRVFRIDAPDNRVPSGRRPNLVAMFNGTGSGRVWVLSHLDIVPPGEYALWHSAPFILRREGDRLYGRGVEDNHQGIVSSCLAVKALRDEGITPVPSVGLIFVADEETGSAYGLRHILTVRPDLFSPQDLIIVPDSGKENGAMIEIAEKSLFWLKFKVTGRQCHASRPNDGINTLRAASRMIVALDETLPKSFPLKDPLFTIPSSTFEPTRKDANVPNINTIPGEDVFYFDCRVLPNYSLSAVQDEVKHIVQAVAETTGVTVTVEPVQSVQAPPATSPESPVVQALTRAIQTVHGRTAVPMGIGGGTVAAFFREHDLPAVVWSTILDNAHTPNEVALISNHLADAKILAHIFLDM